MGTEKDRGDQRGLGVSYGPVFASVSPCQEVNSLAAGRACGWDRELLHRFIRQNPHSGGGLETSLQKLSLPRFAHRTGGAATSLVGLSEVTTSHTGQTWCPEPSLSNPLDKMPGTFCLARGGGGSGQEQGQVGAGEA